MLVRGIASKILSLVALALVASPSVAALNGPFYQCIKTDLTVFEGSVVDAAVATPELSTLVTAVTAADLADTLATAEGITVYAPTDDAFSALPTELLDTVLADTDVLTAVLTYHVTTDPHWAADPRRGANTAPSVVSTLQGQSLSLGFKAGVAPMVNQAMAQCQGVQTDNGIVWIIDSVLLPQF